MESEMTRFDSRSGSQRVDETTNTTATTEATATTATAGAKGVSTKAAIQEITSMAGVVFVETTAGGNIAVAIDQRHAGKNKLRAAGLDVDTDMDLIGSKAALTEAMQNDSEAFNFAARTDAVHIETGVVVTE